MGARTTRRGRASGLDVSGTAVGCDLGGTSLKAVRLGPRGVEASVALPTPEGGRAKSVIDAIAGTAAALLPPGRGKVPVGVAVPGFLDLERKSIVRLSNVPALNGVALAREISRRVSRALVVLDADTNAGAVAEAVLGAGRGHGRVLYVTVGTGLGAALVVDGGPVRVSRHTVGQVAHLPLGERGLRCYCGAFGCAETLLNARGIVHRARELGLGRLKSPLELSEEAGRGTPGGALARRVWRETGHALGRLLQLVAALFSPDAIVVGGGISAAGGLFLPEARRTLLRSLTPRMSPRILVVPAELGPQAGAIGAALLALRANGD